jgi:hypothetical protein
MLSNICSLDFPAKIISVFRMTIGKLDRAAGGLKHIGARSFGFQKSGSSAPAVHDRWTIQTKPFVPFAALS